MPKTRRKTKKTARKQRRPQMAEKSKSGFFGGVCTHTKLAANFGEADVESQHRGRPSLLAVPVDFICEDCGQAFVLGRQARLMTPSPTLSLVPLPATDAPAEPLPKPKPAAKQPAADLDALLQGAFEAFKKLQQVRQRVVERELPDDSPAWCNALKEFLTCVRAAKEHPLAWPLFTRAMRISNDSVLWGVADQLDDLAHVIVKTKREQQKPPKIPAPSIAKLEGEKMSPAAIASTLRISVAELQEIKAGERDAPTELERLPDQFFARP